MKPSLSRLIETGGGGDEVAVIVRMEHASAPLPPGVGVVARFGPVITVRCARRVIPELTSAAGVRSVSAPRLYGPDVFSAGEEAEDLDVQPQDQRRPEDSPASGRGVVIGIVDWGLDFAHPAFRRADGRSRVLALWDQGPGADPAFPNRYGYGRIHDSAAIDAALATPDPYRTLGYDPALSDLGTGSHGTATTSIAAGSAFEGGVTGVAPDAGIVFVHLSNWGNDDVGGLGDSVALLEALDLIRDIAGDRPLAVNLSMGSIEGPCDGTTHVEQAIDAVVQEHPACAVVNSVGNYYQNDTHAAGRLSAGQQARLPVLVAPGATRSREIDIWYPATDHVMVGLIAPDGRARLLTRPGQDRTIRSGSGGNVARVLHRLADADNGRNEATIWLDPRAPAGTWTVILTPVYAPDGSYHVFIGREALHPRAHTRFPPDLAVATTTTGSICNGLHTVTVGAFNAHDEDRPLTDFTSMGPTAWVGLVRPHLLAPGSRVLAARSRPKNAPRDAVPAVTRMSGTSMAAPHVTGAVACMFEAARRPLTAPQYHRALLISCAPYEGSDEGRAGSGYLDVIAAINEVTGTGRPAAGTGGRAATGTKSPEFAQPPEHIGEQAMTDGGRDAGTAASRTEDEALSEPAPGHDQQDRGETRAPDPETVLSRLGTTALDLYNAFVLDREPSLRARLARQVELVAGPGDQLSDPLRAGDVLVRGQVGEGAAMIAVLVDGALLDRPASVRNGWYTDSSLPGCYARVVDAGVGSWEREDQARRITDRQGFVLAGQAILRPAAGDADLKTASALHEAADGVAYGPVTRDPGEMLAQLGATPKELFDAFVLDRNQALRDQLSGRAELLYGSLDLIEDNLRGSDLLVRGAVGEGQAMVAVMVDGELIDISEAKRRGWECEGTLPGCYALVIEGGRTPHLAEDRWARRIADNRRIVPAGQAILRLREPAMAVASPGAAVVSVAPVGEELPGDATGPQALRSPRFAGDATLATVAAGRLRLAAPGTAPYPAPVLSSGAAVAKVQQALMDLGYGLPVSGADGRFGAETGQAVARYKSERGISPSDPVVGPQTMARLDADIIAYDAPPGPVPPTPIDVDRAVQANRQYAVRLGWATRYDINTLLSLNTSSSEQDFARAVANWQGRHGLAVDGIIGTVTWAAMDLLLSAPSAAALSLLSRLPMPNTPTFLSAAPVPVDAGSSDSLAEGVPCSVTVSPSMLTLTQASQTLSAVGSPSSGTFSWSSSNSAVVTVDSASGYQATIKPVAPGTASITVTYNASGTQCSDRASVTILRRNFIVVYGDSGEGVHNLGALPRLAAETHEREIRANQAPGVPAFLPSDTVMTSHVSTVSGLVGQININNVLYLAYFGHSWADGASGFLFIGQAHAPDTNLCDAAGPTCTSAATLPRSAFLPGATVRLFGCRGAFENDSAAEQIARSLGIAVFGFDNSGGSIFTNDPQLGHGQRAATARDLSASVVAGKNVWMVPSEGVPRLRQF